MSKEQDILSAALKLFVTFGFHGTPTSKIAHEAGVANGTLFHYFSTKEDLTVALYNHIKEELADYLATQIKAQEDVATRTKATFVHALQWALEHRDKFYYIQQFHFSPHITKVSPDVIRQQSLHHLMLIEEGIREKVIKDLPVDMLYAFVSSHIFGLYQYLTATAFTADEQKAAIEQGFAAMWDMLKR